MVTMKNKKVSLRTIWFFLALTVILASVACSRDATNGMRLETARRIARPSFMYERPIPANSFMLTAWERVRKPGQEATLYIEGDGLAWLGRRTPSLDPTPVNPVALHLASRDNDPNVIYLARPCQYSKMTDPGACGLKYWTSKRFSPEIIDSIDTAIDNIKKKYQITGFNLVGYSGGGSVAVLIAAHRKDILSLRTVAGNLDIDLFTDIHGVSKMKGSLNPRDVAAAVAHIPQHHFVGSWDEVISPAIYASFVAAAGDRSCIRSTVVEEADHEAGWVNKWPGLLGMPLDCNNR